MIQALPPPRDARGQAIALEPISGLLDLISRAWRPTAVWLFGSRAKGLAKPESDWDLLVVVPDDEPAVDDLMAVHQVCKPSGVPADVILCRATDFEEAREVPNTLAYEAAHFGLRIHGR
ncbi:MAG: nucleotidyltransferase domain-containing protein [Planctomycetes bacterium]|nr:nucleotidyltransferase domain-containing protein [Planctomycetota bacterium]